MKKAIVMSWIAAAATSAALAGAVSARSVQIPAIGIAVGSLNEKAVHPQVRPWTIYVAADGIIVFAGPGKASRTPHAGHLRWDYWSATGAAGSGYDWVDNTAHGVAGGLRTPYPIKFRASEPRHLDGWYVFTRLTVTFTGKLPPNTPARTSTMEFKHESGPLYFWTFPR